jgi:superoxide dismutase, Fe-Mn family
MEYKSRNFESLLGIKGFSNQILQNHFTLYNGYVNNTNKLMAQLSKMVSEGRTAEPDYAEQKRRFGWEFNGMRLHELYFDSLGIKPKMVDGALLKKIESDFGSYGNFIKDFKATGAMRGIGWVILCYEPMAKVLFNVWINEHDVGHLSGCIPLMVMDVFEHAYMIDYQLKKADYIETFLNSIDWKHAEEAYDIAVKR